MRTKAQVQESDRRSGIRRDAQRCVCGHPLGAHGIYANSSYRLGCEVCECGEFTHWTLNWMARIFIAAALLLATLLTIVILEAHGVVP